MNLSAEYFKVHFNIEKQFSMKTSGLCEKECIDKYSEHLLENAKRLFDNRDIFKTKDNFVEILLIENDTIFGIIGKTNMVEQGPMKRVRDSEGKTIKESNLQIDNYRFFLYDLNSHYCVVMNNKDAPAFKTLFVSFLNEYNNKYVHSIFVVPVLDEELIEKYNRSRNLLKISVAFDNTSSALSQLPSLGDLFGISNSDIKKVDLNLDLEASVIRPEEIAQLIEADNVIETNFLRFKLITQDDENIQNTLEFVHRLLTKNIDLDISENQVINEYYYREIKEALFKSLPDFT